MKNILYFENAKKKRTEIAKNIDSISQAIKEIKAFCYQKNPNFNIYYTRLWHSEENELTFDVGSWTEFFYLVGEVPKREQEAQEINTSTADAEEKGFIIDQNKFNKQKAYYAVNFKTGAHKTAKDKPRKRYKRTDNWEDSYEL